MKNFLYKTTKCKKCQKCIHTFNRKNCGLGWYKILTNQTSIKQCKQFRNRYKNILKLCKKCLNYTLDQYTGKFSCIYTNPKDCQFEKKEN